MKLFINTLGLGRQPRHEALTARPESRHALFSFCPVQFISSDGKYDE